jgi:ribonuclease H / adenosylcobalamin/alpha-ribazole phosphatase
VDRLILVRHGETAHNARGLMNPDSDLDSPLTAGGETAARRLGRSLASEPVDLVVTSPRLRARRTAELIAGNRDVEVRVLDDLAEIRAGRFESAPVAEFQEWVLATPPATAAPGGESVLTAARRYLAAARAIRADPAAVVVAVTHNLPMRMLVNAAGGADPVTGPLRRVPQATPSHLSAAELDAAIAGLDAWISGLERPAGGARCAPG